MADTLTPQQMRQLRDALLSAFRSRSSLKQMLFFELGASLDEISSESNLGDTTMNVITWALEQGRLDDLIKGARSANAGNSDLRTFVDAYQAGSTPAPVPVPVATVRLSGADRNKLVGLLLRIASTQLYEGRSALLAGLPADGFNRSATNAQVDLQLILDQLDKTGRLSSGDWPVLAFIDNALAYVPADGDVGRDLQALRDALAQVYKG